MHDQERLRGILKKKMVKTIVCSRPLQPVHLQAMLNFIGNINVYPPLSLQMRTVGPTPISPFGVGQGGDISKELKRDSRQCAPFEEWKWENGPGSNFTLWSKRRRGKPDHSFFAC